MRGHIIFPLYPSNCRYFYGGTQEFEEKLRQLEQQHARSAMTPGPLSPRDTSPEPFLHPPSLESEASITGNTLSSAPHADETNMSFSNKEGQGTGVENLDSGFIAQPLSEQQRKYVQRALAKWRDFRLNSIKVCMMCGRLVGETM